jgi:hypothetical protein
MSVLALEGVVEAEGLIRITTNIHLPQQTKVYILVPEMSLEVDKSKPAYIYSPRLAHPERASHYIMELIEEPEDASLPS